VFAKFFRWFNVRWFAIDDSLAKFGGVLLRVISCAELLLIK
jgi:hypothetical protein